MTENKMVYIASPYAGEVERNVRFAKAACLFAMRQDCTPVAVHLLYPQLLDDSDPAQREAGVRMGLRVLEACDELWLCGDRISRGMSAELTAAKRLGIPVRQIPESEITEVISMEQKYGVWAVRSAASICGAAEAWLKENGEPLRFDTMEQAAEYAEKLNAGICTANVHYYPKEAGPELAPAPRMGMKLC